MVPELREAALDPAIQVGTSVVLVTGSTEMLTFIKEALSVKISRERIGEELDKMMKGARKPSPKKISSFEFFIRKRSSSLNTTNPRSLPLFIDIFDAWNNYVYIYIHP
jgi:hypothetical protein